MLVASPTAKTSLKPSTRKFSSTCAHAGAVSAGCLPEMPSLIHSSRSLRMSHLQKNADGELAPTITSDSNWVPFYVNLPNNAGVLSGQVSGPVMASRVHQGSSRAAHLDEAPAVGWDTAVLQERSVRRPADRLIDHVPGERLAGAGHPCAVLCALGPRVEQHLRNTTR